MTQPFIHLRVRSPYSLLRGAMRIDALLAACKAHAMPAAAIADYDNLFGSLEFSGSALKAGVQPIIATTLSIKPLHDGGGRHKQKPDELLLIAKDQSGYQNLMKLSSLSHIAPEDGEAPLLSYDTVCAHAEGVIALTAGRYGGIGRALLHGRAGDAEALLKLLQNAFDDRLYVELMRHGEPEEKTIEPALIDLAMQHGIALVATNHVFFEKAEHFESHDALLCVAEGRYVSEEERPRLNREYRLKTPEEMRLLFADLPEAIANTAQIARRCAVFSPYRSPILPSFHMTDEDGNVLNETEALRKQASDGLEARLNAHVFTPDMDDAAREAAAKPYRERLEYELDVIITMKFPGYFLIVSDFITWAKEHQIPVGPGRGSGAGSVVAWALLITDLDPLRFGLIFERFLNPERVSMPDFDIDFCQDRREEVIRYVQQKYGKDKVAQIITFGKLQARAVLRDVGRVLQMPYGQVDRICKLVPNNPANPLTLQEALDVEPELRREMKNEEIVAQLIRLSLELEGLYRHASTHAAGVVIADRALDELVPIYRDPKSDMPVTQYSMKYAEGAGLVKFDFLGLKTLTVLQRAVDLINRHPLHSPLEGESNRDNDSVGGVAEHRYNPHHTKLAQSMRKEPTDAEKKLWHHLQSAQLGYKFRRQQPIGDYIVDFYNAEKKVIIEADGGQHADSASDEKRNQWLKSKGFTLLRFWNNEILQHTESVLSKIKETLDNTPHAVSAETAAPPQGGSKAKLNLSTLPFDDTKTYELLARGQTIGVFQFESAGMQDALRKLKPDCLEDLIALGALYRPGPMDNIPTYIAVKHGRQEPDYLHPMLTDVLKETYGVIIYQEQVQKIAQVMAGYTLGGADLLRRAMGKKIKEEMDAQREMFTKGALENGVDKKQASDIFDLVAKFAGYGFNKSHAAAYAVIAYQTAYLKANYPVEFLAASMTYDMHSTDKLSIFRQEAIAMGIDILPPDVNASEAKFDVEAIGVRHPAGGVAAAQDLIDSVQSAEADSQNDTPKLAIRYALGAIKNVGEQAMAALVAERKANGAFKDVFDFAQRMDSSVMNRRQLEHLIMAGALDSLCDNRRQLYESIDMLIGISQSATAEKASNQNSLFGDMQEASASANFRLKPCSDWGALDRLHHEFSAIGFYLSAHPLDGYKTQLEKARVVPVAELEDRLGFNYTSIQIAGIITGKKVKVSSKGKFAFVTLSDATGLVEFSVFNEELLAGARDLLENGAMVLVRADAKREDGGARLIAQSIEPLEKLHSQGQSTLELELESAAPLETIKDLLGAPQPKASVVVISLPIPNHLAKLKLAQRFALSPETLSQLAATEGVKRAELL